jgi:hypothetical protein
LSPQDGALNNEELNNFQYQCFGQPLTPDELESVRQMVAERMADGLNDAGGWVGGWVRGWVLFYEDSTWQVRFLPGFYLRQMVAERMADGLNDAGGWKPLLLFFLLTKEGGWRG